MRLVGNCEIYHSVRDIGYHVFLSNKLMLICLSQGLQNISIDIRTLLEIRRWLVNLGAIFGLCVVDYFGSFC